MKKRKVNTSTTTDETEVISTETKQEKLEVQYLPIETLVPYARNARTHSDEQIDQIVASIREFGWTNPILIDGNGGILAGHGRVLAAQRLGMASVPCISLAHLTEAQRRAYILADNQLALNAGWDAELLKLELADLDAMGFEMPVLGFSDDELKDFMSDEPPKPKASKKKEPPKNDADDDEIPDLPTRLVTRPGDLWHLGPHRLICGDAGDGNIVTTLMQDNLAALCFTSPPYDSQREYANGAPDDWTLLMKGVCQQLPMRENGQVLINLGLVHNDGEFNTYWQRWLNWMRIQGWRRFGWYVWDQGAGLPGDWGGRFAPSFEFVFHFNRQGRKPNKIVPCVYAGEETHLREDGSSQSLRNEDGSIKEWTHAGKPTQSHRIPDSVIRVQRQKGGIGRGIDHPAVFPRALPAHIMLAFTDPDEICYEPFSGSGTSLLAAQETGRILRAVELAPAYVDIAIIRFRRAYGDLPVTLASTGESFDAVTARRLVEQPDEAVVA
jgi:DNA modification methylase